ncbi:MAG: Fe-S cluster assembly ATP-binding protein [Parcubacteria group bacterium Gr01-1014_30]|nr:MAG: Fe-S cluster assembly ATP-binding protein [Parcubacteria group bacterium Gr01-1014_30]
MLTIKNLQVSTEGKEILKGVDLEIKAGQTHAIMGQNGSGKTTLAKIIAGQQEGFLVQGRISFLGKNLLQMEPEERAKAGIFMAFQSPIEIPGLALASFLTSSLNEISKSRGERPLDPMDFSDLAKEEAAFLGLKQEFLARGVNEGFSGGERKKNEIFQMRVLRPLLSILDEIDSGLDVDSLKKVAQAINESRTRENSFLIITHYQRILNYIKPDFVHVMVGGRIARSGGAELALEIEEKGYGHLS